MLCPCGLFTVGCWGGPSAGGTVSAAPSSTTAVCRHLRGDFLLRSMDDPFDLSVEAVLGDTEDLQMASAVAAHLHALRHWRKRARGSRVHRWPRSDGSVPGRRPNQRRNFRSRLRVILRDYFVSMRSRLSTTRVTLSVGSAFRAACFFVYTAVLQKPWHPHQMHNGIRITNPGHIFSRRALKKCRGQPSI